MTRVLASPFLEYLAVLRSEDRALRSTGVSESVSHHSIFFSL